MSRETQDLYFAAFLIAGEGLQLASVQRGDPYSTFLFTEEISEEARARYFSGAAPVPAHRYAEALKDLKRLMIGGQRAPALPRSG